MIYVKERIMCQGRMHFLKSLPRLRNHINEMSGDGPSMNKAFVNAVFDAAAGDVITFKTHSHEEELEIVTVCYKEIP